MSFIDKLKSLLIRLLLAIKCKSSCFNTSNNTTTTITISSPDQHTHSIEVNMGIVTVKNVDSNIHTDVEKIDDKNIEEVSSDDGAGPEGVVKGS